MKNEKKKAERVAGLSDMSEKVVERYLTAVVRSAGGLCLKYYNPWQAGYPDRLVLLPHGVAAFVELKSRGEKPRKMQRECMKNLERIGHLVFTADSREQVDNIMRELALISDKKTQEAGQ